jgi:hypothetical protein
MVSNNFITNCPVTLSDVSNTRAIFGPDLPSIQEKTVQRTPLPVVGDYVAVPRSLLEENKLITLAADMFFVDGMVYLLMVARQNKFVTMKDVPVRTALSLSKHLMRVPEVYGCAGFSKNYFNGWGI